VAILTRELQRVDCAETSGRSLARLLLEPSSQRDGRGAPVAEVGSVPGVKDAAAGGWAAGGTAGGGGLPGGMGKRSGEGSRSPEGEGNALVSDALATGVQPRHSISSCTGSISGSIHASHAQANTPAGGGHVRSGVGGAYGLHGLDGLHAQNSSGSGPAQHVSGTGDQLTLGSGAAVPQLSCKRAACSSRGGDDASAQSGASDGRHSRCAGSLSHSPGGSWSSGSPTDPQMDTPPRQRSPHCGTGSSHWQPGMFTAPAEGMQGGWQTADRPAGCEAAAIAA
jgi:hypothetical protein